MNINDAYISFLIKVNQNLKSSNIAASKDRFVIIYNEEQVRRVDYILGKKNNDEIRDIQFLLKTETINTVNNTIGNKVAITLPSDFLNLSSTYCTVKTETCKDIRLSLFEIKDFNSEEVLTDENNAPSLKYREAPYYIGSDSLQIFTKDFTVEKAVLTYYKYPRKVDISGYQKFDSTASTDIDPEGDDAFVNKVISMSAESFYRNYGDPQQIQINKDRVINNN